ncbi:major capsid protein [Nocardia sp. CDC159]|uniref:Major capsid protein n=1 Tax=Nocardia pulmonis TaxID=2951408 RepID=A0A9X2E6G0_9NOCA|nr:MULTISPECIES: major capsid protein [Nocardia]MCM6774992.1 major capsid protein [Nocardia pulmonis]MCM6789923.1 major capsid protein [Nocardia sp. CDC159]
MSFQLPEQMPTSREDLAALRQDADAEFQRLAQSVEADNAELSDEDLTYLRYLADALATIDAAIADIDTSSQQRRAEAARILDSVRNRATDSGGEDDEAPDGDEDDGEDDPDAEAATGGEVVAEAERATREAAAEQSVTAANRRRTSFAGANRGRAPRIPAASEPQPTAGWRMRPDAPGYQPGFQPLESITAGLAAAAKGSGSAMARPNGTTQASGHTPQYLGQYVRDVPAVEDYESLDAVLAAAVGASQHEDGSLTAACCPPPQVSYDFCPVEPARDLFVLPEVTAERCAISWPAEFDITLNWQVLCEAELNADPPTVKQCHQVPCPDEFNELRLCYLPLCVESDIIGDQAWPERVNTFTQKLMAAQARRRSMWMLQKILSDPTTREMTIPALSQIGAASSILNSLTIAAMGVRATRKLARDAVVAGAAPTLVFELIRNDLANQEGVATFEITDAQVVRWLDLRRIQLQFVGEWQTWDPDWTEFPDTVDIALWEQGAYFALVKPVIDLGVMYPRELLQINRYTRMFTEDGLNVGKRCGDSVVVTIPVCPNGAIGNRMDAVCAAGS